MRHYEELEITLVELEIEDIVRTSPTADNDNDVIMPDFPETNNPTFH